MIGSIKTASPETSQTIDEEARISERSLRNDLDVSSETDEANITVPAIGLSMDPETGSDLPLTVAAYDRAGVIPLEDITRPIHFDICE